MDADFDITVLRAIFRSADRRGSGGVNRPRILLVLAVIALMAITACSSTSPASGPKYSTSYFRNPDEVWAGIELALDAMGYIITQANRPDGKIQASPKETGGEPEIVLFIDQVARTDDQVNVYVKPRFGDGETRAESGELEAVGRDFLAVLERKIGG